MELDHYYGFGEPNSIIVVYLERLGDSLEVQHAGPRLSRC